MPNYRRAKNTGGSYFFSVVTHNRQPILTREDVRHALRDAITQVRTTLPFEIDAWVLLPDHLHCVWTLPKDDADFSTRWRLIKTKVTQQCRDTLEQPRMLSDRREAKNQSTIWQNRFWEHAIRDDDDFAKHVDYVHWNPVKHGRVKHVKDWPYSSFHRYVKRNVYPLNWASGDDDFVGVDGGE